MFDEFFLIFLINLAIYLNRNKIIKFYNVYDLPDKKRKIHKFKTSLLGGYIFFINIIFFSIIIFFSDNFLVNSLVLFDNINNYFTFFFISACFYFLGFFDDKYNLNANLKFLIITLLIIFIIYFDKDLQIRIINFSFTDRVFDLKNLSFIFTLFCFIAYINAFNLYDGINLQIGIYFLIILIFLAFVTNFNYFIISLFFPLFVFLILNSEGKIFLGNSGTYLISFIISYLFIKTFNLFGTIFSDQILLIMLIPGLDMIRLFFTRIKSKKHPFTPDRNHIHHKFLEVFGYKKTIILISILSFLPIILINYLKSYFTILFIIFFYFFIIFALKKLIKSLD
jgi:UDP-GlcNAc:undecaprenyl-phosphate/decaprenyl-phosphate GlcNAc-1-phosphate transferase